MQNISLQDFKTSCSKLSVELKENGVKIPHTKLLNMVAHSLGYKDYNTFKGIQNIKEKNGYRIYADKEKYQNCFFLLKKEFETLLSEKFNQVFIRRQNCDFIEVDITKINSSLLEKFELRLIDFFKESRFIDRIEHIVFQDVSQKLLSFDKDDSHKTINRFPFFLSELKRHHIKAFIKYIDENNIYIKTEYNEKHAYRNTLLPDEHFIISSLKSDMIIQNAKIDSVFYDGVNSYLNTSQGKVYFDLTDIVLKSFKVKNINNYTGRQNILFYSPPGRGKTTLIETVILPKLKNKKIAVTKYDKYTKNDTEYYDNKSHLSFLDFDTAIKNQKVFDILYISLPSVDILTNEQKENLVLALKNRKDIHIILDVQIISEDLRVLFEHQVIDYEIFEYINGKNPNKNIIQMIEL